MKVIFIRGLPGTGKTIVTELLKEKLPNSEVINVDDFKINPIQNGETLKNIMKIAYKQLLKRLYEFSLINKEYVIIDELICEKRFLKKIFFFLNQTNSLSYWFRLRRKLKELLKVEAGRNRKIKNSLKDFSKLKKKIESLKIAGEYQIKNDDLDLTVKKIMSYLNKF